MTDIEKTVIRGDAFASLSDLEDDSAHAAVIDYPWEFQIRNGTGRFEYRNDTRGTGEGDRDLDHDKAMFDMVSDDRLPELVDELARVLVPGAWVLFMADDRFQDVIRDTLKADEEFIFRRNWVWTPGTMGMGSYGRVDHYPIPTATLGETDRYVNDRGTLYHVPNGRDTDYPTGKPVSLYRQILADPVIREGETLLEPFCGSAPGASVAVARGLGYWGCDVDVDAVERARARLEQNIWRFG